MKSTFTAVCVLAALGQSYAGIFAVNTGVLNSTGGNGNLFATAFQIGSETSIAALGVYAPAGFSGPLTVSLWTTGDGSYSSSLPRVAYAVISSGIPDQYGYVYASMLDNSDASLPTYTIAANISYALSVSGYGAGNQIGASGDPAVSYPSASQRLDLGFDGVGNPYHDGAYSTPFGVRSIASFSTVLSTVPEPETYAMLAGLGLVGFGLYRRCRK